MACDGMLASDGEKQRRAEKVEYVTSRKNPKIAHLKRLGTSRSYRKTERAFLCDGQKLLSEAIHWGGKIQMVLLSERMKGIAKMLPKNTIVLQAPEELVQWVSPLEQAQDCLFACALPENAVPPALTGNRYAVLDSLQDPGNVGAILRTAAAFSLDGVFLTGACADLWNPKTIRATMGAVFRIPAWQTDYETAHALLKAQNIPLYGAALRESRWSPLDIDWNRSAVAIGNEGQGLSETLMALCDGFVQIPMDPRCESLNAAAAAAVFFWEMAGRSAAQ